ncbi:broad specificity phosphatase PhoE [Collimonas sp. PA-H2]|uniref:histidine phosphatase family protein n=1 Tax=Collimonas sp. PA-H2 TaxID=1881062 RepID=UPI000C003A6F|nr:histidine phosphatase family protein [Collimonas sp. PA-H2]PFH10618.1 broad specificity phosphatase PhoE [Collimonas sp. PA-H2]
MLFDKQLSSIDRPGMMEKIYSASYVTYWPYAKLYDKQTPLQRFAFNSFTSQHQSDKKLEHMTLYFIRHGESIANEQNYFAGTLNSPLTRLGRRQAQQAAQHIRRLNLVFDEVHVSTLERAQATSRIILEAETAYRPKVVHTDALIERNFGIFSGENKTMIKKSIGYTLYDYFFHDIKGTPPQGESWMEMYARCKTYYDEVLAPLDQQGKQVLVVAHKYIVEVFALLASGLSPDKYIDFKLPNSRPLSWDELKRLTTNSSSTLNYVGEHIEIYLPQWTLGAAFAGGILSLIGVSLPSTWSGVMIALLLAVNSLFLALRIDVGSLRSRFGPQSIALVALSFFRLVSGGILLTRFHSEWLHLIGLLLIVPPALSVPTFSLARGGDYFFAARNTIVLSILSPVALLIATVIDPEVISNVEGLHRFYMILLVALAIPALLAQTWRYIRPIAAGSVSTNYGWIGSLMMIPLALLTAMRVNGSTMIDALRSDTLRASMWLLLPLAVLIAVRIVSELYVRLQSLIVKKTIHASMASDLYLLQTSPNIFLWLSLLMPSTVHHAPMLITGTLLGFFAFMFFEEAILVGRFRFRIKSLIETAGLTVAKA